MEDIAVITVNYNTSDFTLQCVGSILEKCTSTLKFRIVIVDNNSGELEFNKLRVLNGDARILLLRNKSNEGFSKANMIGVNSIQAKYYYFLNNDTLLLNDVPKILYDFMEKNTSAGISSGQMYHEDGKLGINFNYFPDLKLKLLGSEILRVITPGKFPKKGIEYDYPVQVPLLNGSSLFTRARAFDMVGGFDTNFFLYCEEEDLALRMKQKGYESYLIPEAKYIHFSSKSSQKNGGINYIMIREFYISQYYLYKKHYGKIASYIWRITQFFRSLRKFYIHRDYVKLAFFIVRGPGFDKSLRHSQE